MIPHDYITTWRSEAPWVEDAQVEQDLVISRALVNIFSHPVLHEALAFRGGTALYKLYLKPAARYSEDIDLVQVDAEPAGPVMQALHEVLDHWLGEPKYKQTDARVTFTYRFASEDTPSLPLRLKVEINTREHFTVSGLTKMFFEIKSRWFNGSCDINTYELNELLGTKLRALYQRKKGRDLFDLAVALDHPEADPERIIEIMYAYLDHSGRKVTKRQFENNFANKLKDQNFVADIGPLIATEYEWNVDVMSELVTVELIDRLAD